MKKVSTADLKAHLGKYLGMVKEGQTLYVTSHRRPVAQLSPSQVDESLAVQTPTAPMSRLKNLKGIKRSPAIDGVGELLGDRRRR
ncbi:MAG: type II toxin-antitoxin system prevent-host-death family antitoxin [Verrucomicrobia bacterium]|nr:type II toxin-antitoxin system prevent-host-death family antitoxin [Verrucomicrobiota bacterium]